MNLFCRYTEVFQTKRYLIPDGIFGAGELIERILKDQSDFFAEFCGRCGSRGDSVNRYFTAVSPFIKLGNQTAKRLAECTFSGSVFSDDSDKFALFSSERNIIQRQPFRMWVAVF